MLTDTLVARCGQRTITIAVEPEALYLLLAVAGVRHDELRAGKHPQDQEWADELADAAAQVRNAMILARAR